MHLDRIRLGAFLGLGSSLGFLALYLVAMATNPSYRFGSNYLSDLGDTSGNVSGVVANPWPFNIACILGGALAIPFGFLALRPPLPRTRLSAAGVLFLAVAAFFLILVGVFNESYEGLHRLVTAVFFLGMVVALALLSRPMLSVPAFGRPMVSLNLVTLVL